MGVTEVVAGVKVVVVAAQQYLDVSHEFRAGMLHTNLLSALHFLTSHVSLRFNFKTQFSAVLLFGSPLRQLV